MSLTFIYDMLYFCVWKGDNVTLYDMSFSYVVLT